MRASPGSIPAYAVTLKNVNAAQLCNLAHASAAVRRKPRTPALGCVAFATLLNPKRAT